MNTNELEFAVFCIENVAEELGLTGAEIYRLLTEKSDILDNYIIPCYDALHTQGRDYIVNDITGYMREKGLVPKADRALLQYKYDSVIEELSGLKGITLRQALDMFYKSQTYSEIREGISDMHCRSDKYLAEDILAESGE